MNLLWMLLLLLMLPELLMAQEIDVNGEGKTCGLAQLNAQHALEKDVFHRFYPQKTGQAYDAVFGAALFNWLTGKDVPQPLEVKVSETKSGATGSCTVSLKVDGNKVEAASLEWKTYLEQRLALAEKLNARGLEQKAFEQQVEAWYLNGFLKLIPPQKAALPPGWERFVVQPELDSIAVRVYQDSLLLTIPEKEANRRWIPVLKFNGALIAFEKRHENRVSAMEIGSVPDVLDILWIIQPLKTWNVRPLVSIEELPSLSKTYPVKKLVEVAEPAKSDAAPDWVKPFLQRTWTTAELGAWVNRSRSEGNIAVSAKPEAFENPKKAFVFITDKEKGLLHVLQPLDNGFISLSNGKTYAALSEFAGLSALWILSVAL
jgi:hypothetical protein